MSGPIRIVSAAVGAAGDAIRAGKASQNVTASAVDSRPSLTQATTRRLLSGKPATIIALGSAIGIPIAAVLLLRTSRSEPALPWVETSPTDPFDRHPQQYNKKPSFDEIVEKAQRQDAVKKTHEPRAEADVPLQIRTNVDGVPDKALVLYPQDRKVAKKLFLYLREQNSPLTSVARDIVAIGRYYRVDPRLIVAISGGESSFGKRNIRPHNAWGWLPKGGTHWETFTEGANDVASGLRTYYLDKGRTSVEAIQKKYCPVGAKNDPTGLNQNWLGTITQFYSELGGDPNNVRWRGN
jgi:hypothetical protein